MFDDAIVGAGILGLADAYGFHRGASGMRTAAQSGGGFDPNFGMIWPIGQPAGSDYHLALRSRQHWLNVLEQSGLGTNASARSTWRITTMKPGCSRNSPPDPNTRSAAATSGIRP